MCISVPLSFWNHIAHGLYGTYIFLIPYLFDVFQDSYFSGSRCFRVQAFQAPGFLGSGSRVLVQVLEVASCNLKFIIFHADDVNSVKMYKGIFRKVKWDRFDKLVGNTRTNFCSSYLFRVQSRFWRFCKS